METNRGSWQVNEVKLNLSRNSQTLQGELLTYPPSWILVTSAHHIMVTTLLG